MTWRLLVLSLPTENATARMRAWRSLKAAGAAVLRDGVYLLPDGDAHGATLQAVADDVRQGFISAAAARRDYGVAVNDDGIVAPCRRFPARGTGAKPSWSIPICRSPSMPRSDAGCSAAGHCGRIAWNGWP